MLVEMELSTETRLALSPRHESFHRIARLAARIAGVPAALVIFGEGESQHIVATSGLEPNTTLRALDLPGAGGISQTIVLYDLIQEGIPVFGESLGYRFFAAFPIPGAGAPDASRLCLLDIVPRALTTDQCKVLEDLALLASSERAKATADTLLDVTQDAIYILGREGEILFWNQRAREVYGWTRDMAIGQHAGGLLHDAEDTRFDRACVEVFANGFWRGEMRQVNQRGEVVVVQSRWTSVRESPELPGEILVVNTDITEQRSLETQLLRSQRMESLGTLAGGIAHDMNNMLGPIMMSVQLLRGRTQDEKSIQLLNTLEASAQRGADLLRQVLSFARGVEGERVPVDVRRLIHEVQSLLGEALPPTIEQRVYLEDHLWAVEGDPTQLHQVLMNLSVNARDAMPDGGMLRVRAVNIVLDEAAASHLPDARSGRFVMIAVTDTGTGMSQDVLDKIFDPFFTTKSRGTGLGLSTTLGIVKSHGGYVAIDSEPGHGSQFRVYLPACDVENETPAYAEEGASPDGAGETILVIDDEPAMRMLTQSVLEEHGYRVLLASDGKEGLERYARHRADIAAVVTDIMMPSLDGSRLMQALYDMNPEVKIVAVSGGITREQLLDRVGVIPHDFLAKPYGAADLLRLMRAVLAS
ncbi:MAG: ATP-binding protein [Rhodothermales bacterium]